MAGRPRTPTNVLRLKGSLKKNPARYEDRANEPTPSRAIGYAPRHLSSDERACWHELVERCHPGTVFHEDSIVIELGAILMNKLRFEPYDDQVVSKLIKVLSMLGLSPSDRSRVARVAPKENENPFKKFA